MKEVVKYLRDIGLLLVLVWLAWNVTRWLTDATVSPQQTHTIDSLRTENERLDRLVNFIEHYVDSVKAANDAQERRESRRHKHQLDSLQTLIPDTATVVARPVHEAIVLVKDAEISRYRNLWLSERAALTLVTDSLDTFRRQNAALLAQVNDLEDKANPGLFRRLKYAAPFVVTLYGACKLGVLECDS